jgi:hypothetical protein
MSVNIAFVIQSQNPSRAQFFHKILIPPIAHKFPIVMIFQNTTIMPNDTDVISDHTVINPPIVPPIVSPSVVPPVVEVQGGNGGNDEVLSDIENEGDTDEDSDIISVHTVYSLSSSTTISIHTIIVISD